MKKPNDKKRPNSNSGSLGQFLRWREMVHGGARHTSVRKTRAMGKTEGQVRGVAPNMRTLTMGLAVAMARRFIRRRASV